MKNKKWLAMIIMALLMGALTLSAPDCCHGTGCHHGAGSIGGI